MAPRHNQDHGLRIPSKGFFSNISKMFWLVGQIITINGAINGEVFGVFFVAFCLCASLVLDFALLVIRVFFCALKISLL